MKWRFTLSILAVLCLSVLSGCLSFLNGPETVLPADHEATAVEETLQAYHTAFALQTENAALEPTGVTPENSETPAGTSTTAINPVATRTPAGAISASPTTPATALPTHTINPSATATQMLCNQAQFVNDITIPDGTVIGGNSLFKKTWRLKNTGSCEWTTDYDLVFVNGNSMNGPAAVNLVQSVKPGDTIDLSIDLIAPKEAGKYKGNWKLRSGSGSIFGIGANAAESFFVEIEVTGGSADLLVPMDFAALYCSAEWSSSKSTSIACPSAEDLTNGSVQRDLTPTIEENYEDDEIALIMVPANDTGGMISGRYPALTIANGDRFTALTGCMSASPNCSVTFEIVYSANGGPRQTLKAWEESFDGSFTPVDVDLSGFTGQSVVIILQVSNRNGSSQDDRAFWMVPRIIRKGG